MSHPKPQNSKASEVERNVWILACSGILAGLVIIFTAVFLLQYLDSQRVAQAREQKQVSSELEQLSQKLGLVVKESLMTSSGQVLGEGKPAIEGFLAQVKHETDQHSTEDHVSAWVGIIEGATELEEDWKQNRQWLQEKQAAGQNKQKAYNHVLQELKKLQDSSLKVSGKQRLVRAMQLKKLNKLKGEPALQAAKKILRQKQNGGVSKVKFELTDLSVLIEKLYSCTAPEELASLKDNYVSQALGRIQNALNDAADLFSKQEASDTIDLASAIFGKSFINDKAHQTLIPGEGGLYSAIENSLSLKAEKHRLRIQSLEIQEKLKASILLASNELSRMQEKDNEELKQTVQLVTILLVIGYFIGVVAFLFLAAKISKVVRNQIAEINEQQMVLQRAQSLIDGLYENAPLMLGVIEMDGRSIKHLSSNPAANAFFAPRGGTLEAGLSLRQVGPESNPEIWQKHYAKCEASRSPAKFEYETDDESSRFLSCTVAFIGKSENGNSRFAFIVDDVTQDRIARKQLEEANKEANAANAAKTDFLANMSHEIRTPMTAILGFTDILLEPDESTKRKTEAAETIRRNGEHLIALINDILDISKTEAGQLTVEAVEVPVVNLMRDVYELMKVRSDAKGLQFDIEFDGPIPEKIQSDPTRLKQILVNILGNAIKFTEVGEVKVIVRQLIRADQPAMIEFEVIDNGIGMTSKQAENVFEPFVQADSTMTRKFGGTGLGLPISKRLAEALSGGIYPVCSVGKGCSFNIQVAMGELKNVNILQSVSLKDVIKDPIVKSKADDSMPLDGVRVLYAEDGPDNQRLVAHFMKKAGAQLMLADNGRIAVDAIFEAEEKGEAFHVILMDMQMPVLDGYGAVKELRQRNFEGPIMALTAHAMAGDKERCIECGCTDFDTKPFKKARLIEKISKLVVAVKQ